MQKLLQDMRFALRQMARSHGFSLTAILSLALRIGVTVSVFSLIYSAILNAWPYTGFDKVCQVNTVARLSRCCRPEPPGEPIRRKDSEASCNS
jgi:hypothetical protein